MEPDVHKVVELLFARKLQQFQGALGAVGAGDADDSSPSMARTTLLAACGEILHGHCGRVLRDYIALLELFDGLTDDTAVGTSFDAHVDHAASEILSSFGRERTSGAKPRLEPSRGDQVRARAQLQEEVDRATRASKSASAAPDELDDRLPLGRRGAFDRDLGHAVVESKRNGEPLALVMIDIDHFKQVNDVHGHPVGDEVLVEVAKLVVNRALNKGGAYRFGGEEFSLLLPGYSSEEAVGLAERIRKDLEDVVVSSKKLKVTAELRRRQRSRPCNRE